MRITRLAVRAVPYRRAFIFIFFCPLLTMYRNIGVRIVELIYKILFTFCILIFLFTAE